MSVNLRLFDGNTNVTGDAGMSVEMRTYYNDTLIDNAKPNLVHDQFAQKKPIPRGKGKTIQFRKYSPLPKALVPLTEGVTPDGKKLNVTDFYATIQQYGDFVEISDILDMTAVDDNIVEATELLGDQAGATLDTVTREVLNGGTAVQYAEGQVSSRSQLTKDHKLTVKCMKLAARHLKNQKAKKVDGKYYVAIAHVDTLYDLMNDPEWIEASKYAGSTQIFEGEVGKIAGFRFIETTEAKIFEKAGAPATAGDDNTKISVYSTLAMGANAYGVTEIEGGGLQQITKQLGSAGTADPLDQRATAGWKATKVAERLVENYLLRIETGCTFNGAAN